MAELTTLAEAVADLVHDGDLVAPEGAADTVVSVPEIFDPWLQAGRTDAGFLGAPRHSTASAP